MDTTPFLIFIYALVPMAISIVGGAIASYYVPKERVVNGIQHFVAGIVLAAVAVELIPKILGKGSALTIGIGFVLGVALMLGVHELAHFLSDRKRASPYPMGLVAGAGIDLLIDGMLIGVAFAAGRSSGIFVGLSLSFCAFFLNLSVGTRLVGLSMKTKWTTVIGVAVMLPIGAFTGGQIIAMLPAYWLTEAIAFGVAALLFLGAEELLKDAHKQSHGIISSALFFLGFLVILLFKL